MDLKKVKLSPLNTRSLKNINTTSTPVQKYTLATSSIRLNYVQIMLKRDLQSRIKNVLKIYPFSLSVTRELDRLILLLPLKMAQ